MSINKSVLYVDDNWSYLSVVKDFLEDSVLELLTTSDPHEGLRMAMVNQKIDLIMLDIDMPGMTGIEILTQLRKLQRTSKIPVLMLSAHDDLDTIQKIHSLGVDDYLLKPFELNDLFERLCKFFGRNIFEFKREK
ncbi:MAG: response regulator [Candidatus Sericytochromatia bacterium]|nr:response regulator [Candidatus Sericytochromatia bacterium]